MISLWTNAVLLKIIVPVQNFAIAFCIKLGTFPNFSHSSPKVSGNFYFIFLHHVAFKFHPLIFVENHAPVPTFSRERGRQPYKFGYATVQNQTSQDNDQDKTLETTTSWFHRSFHSRFNIVIIYTTVHPFFTFGMFFKHHIMGLRGEEAVWFLGK